MGDEIPRRCEYVENLRAYEKCGDRARYRRIAVGGGFIDLCDRHVREYDDLFAPTADAPRGAGHE